MNLTRTQVKALLNIASNDDSRPVLTRLQVSEYKGNTYLVCTDSYHLAALWLSNEVLTDLIDKSVSRDDVTKWYKLATGKDRFTLDTVQELAKLEEGAKYPEWQKLMNPEALPITTISFNSKYITDCEIVAGRSGLAWQLSGKLKPMVAQENSNEFIVMPLKV